MKAILQVVTSLRLLRIAVAIGIGVSVWIVKAGGPTERLTATWMFGLRALVLGVIVAEIITQILTRREK